MTFEAWVSRATASQAEALEQTSLGFSILHEPSLLPKVASEQTSELNLRSPQSTSAPSPNLFGQTFSGPKLSVSPESSVAQGDVRLVPGNKPGGYLPLYGTPAREATPFSTGQLPNTEANPAPERSQNPPPQMVAPLFRPDSKIQPILTPEIEKEVPQGYPTRLENPSPIEGNPGVKTLDTPAQENQTPSQLEVIDRLNQPYVSDTGVQMNKFFEPIWRGGTYAFWAQRDGLMRPARVEKWIAEQQIVSDKNYFSFLDEKERMLKAVKTPLAEATGNLQKIIDEHPNLFQSNGQGTAGWSWESFTPEQEKAASRWIKLKDLNNDLEAPWKIKDINMRNQKVSAFGIMQERGMEPIHVSESKLSKQAWLKAEGLDAQARNLDDAFNAVVDDANFARNRFTQARIDARGEILKGIGILGASWITNFAVDTLLDTKAGPSPLTYTVDAIAPMILLTDRRAWFKFAVLTGTHFAARTIEKSLEPGDTQVSSSRPA